MPKTLLVWIGKTDIRASKGEDVGLGPIAQAAKAGAYAKILLLNNYNPPEPEEYVRWIRQFSAAAIELRSAHLTTPTAFGEIYREVVCAVDDLLAQGITEDSLVFHLSPGTPAMAAIWILLAKSRYRKASLIESSLEQGVRSANIPFDISAEFLPDLMAKRGAEIERLASGQQQEFPEFSEIIFRSKSMERAVVKAQRASIHGVPILIEGESGTGKELFARAIHNASARADKPFRPVNCGAIPAGLIESELFGHEKGAFTGADKPRPGYFEEANGGSLFLDEIGELPLEAQVKLLRILQDKEVYRVGSNKPIAVDVRIIAATNRNLLDEVAVNRFRSDLFYRLAVALIVLPPLRERPGDIGLLIDHLLKKVNAESKAIPGYLDKNISSSARNILLSHPWPGNIRELLSTIQRAAVWSSGENIDDSDIREALLPTSSKTHDEILGKPLGGDLNLHEIIGKVARHYLERALVQSHGNKSEAATLVGLASYQTLTNWIKKYGLES